MASSLVPGGRRSDQPDQSIYALHFGDRMRMESMAVKWRKHGYECETDNKRIWAQEVNLEKYSRKQSCAKLQNTWTKLNLVGTRRGNRVGTDSAAPEY